MSNSQQAHPFDFLTPDSVISATESCGFISDARILALNSYENRVYQVGIEDSDPVIVKFYRPQRWSDAQILEEHEFTRELAELEFPAVAPLIINDKTMHTYEGFRFAIYPRKGGRSPDLDNMDNILIMGRFMGRLHAVGSVQPFKYRNELTLDRFVVKSVQYLLENQFLPADLVNAYSTLCDDLINKMQAIIATLGPLTQIRIHGDCHMGNVLWRDECPNFVDFDDAMNGPAIQDLWMLLSGERNEQQLQLSELVEGYNEFYSFDPKELAMVETLRTLRLIHYSAWLARRWADPAFPLNFPWFNTENYWASHILELREQLSALDEPPLQLF